MKEESLRRNHRGPMGILTKTALLSWLVAIITIAVFVAGILPGQKRTFLENLKSKAHGVSVSLQDVAAGAVVTEDFSEVVDHCMEVLAGDETIEHLVLTRNDGFALIHTREGWRSEQLGPEWCPATRKPTNGIQQPLFLTVEVFQYSRPFGYSGIEWGWIHVGLSLDSYRENVKASYWRTGWLALLCILLGLVASVVYAKRLVTPILRLRHVAQLVADGDLSARAEVNTGDEVEALADGFNTMTQAVQDREARVRTQNRQLASLVTENAFHDGRIEKAARRVAQVSAETLGVESVSVWMFNDDRSAIDCLDRFDLSSRTHSVDGTATRSGKEAYFSALEGERVLATSDPTIDPRTSCLAESYLLPLKISSLMHAAIRLEGRVAGVICHEHIGKGHHWTAEEENFAGSVADLMALALEGRNRRAVQEELLAAKEAAEAASEAKSQFLANMSHEIRTPINGVMGMLQIIEDDDLTEKQRRYVTAASSSARTLLNVIGDVLDFSKIEAGHLELERSDFSLEDSIDRSVRMFAEQAETQGIELYYVVASEIPDRLVGDPNRIQQVVINLIGNALKFTEAGEVNVKCQLADLSETDATVRVNVHDTGCGIHPDQLETVFESLAQGDSSMQRSHGGTGLGLAISRRLISLMGGEIGVASTVGVGSTFWFTLRLEQQRNAADDSAKRRPSTRELRVLVVDDSKTSREVIGGHARAWGCQMGQAANASEALDELRRGVEVNAPYEIALIDACMSGIDGLRLARLVNDNPQFASTRLILLSGFREPAKEELDQAAIVAVVPKPVRASDLYDAIFDVDDGPPERLATHPENAVRTKSISASKETWEEP